MTEISKKVRVVLLALALVAVLATLAAVRIAFMYRERSAEKEEAADRAESLTEDVYDLEAEIASLNSQIESLKNKVSDAEEDYTELYTDYSELKENVDDISNELSSKEGELAEATAELDEKNRRITALEKRLNKQLGRYDDAVAEKTQLGLEVAELEKQISQLEADIYRLRTAAAVRSYEVAASTDTDATEAPPAPAVTLERETETEPAYAPEPEPVTYTPAYVPSGEVSEDELMRLLQYGVPLKWYRNADGSLYRAPSQFTAYGYYDITSSETMLYNSDTVYYSASLIKAPYIYSVLLEITEFERTAERDENGDVIYGEGEERYDLDEVWTFDPETMMAEGSGELQSMPKGTQMTWRELFSYVLLWSDNVAWNQIMERFGSGTFYRLVGELGIQGTSSDFMDLSVNDCIAFLREIYAFFETGEPLAEFMKENMMKSKHDVMICAAFPEDTVPHKYGWDKDSYHDMAIIYDEHPYILVIMTDLHDGTDEDNAFVRSVVELTKQLHEKRYE